MSHKITDREKALLVIDCVAVLIGDYGYIQKKAALLLLKAFLPHNVLQSILEDDGVYPFSRNDARVKKWTKEVVGRGKCEICGATENLEAHHMMKWSEYPKGRIDPRNGQCLCHECHTNEHIDDSSYHMMKAKCSKRK